MANLVNALTIVYHDVVLTVKCLQFDISVIIYEHLKESPLVLEATTLLTVPWPRSWLQVANRVHNKMREQEYDDFFLFQNFIESCYTRLEQVFYPDDQKMENVQEVFEIEVSYQY